jgi:hypothetical protein
MEFLNEQEILEAGVITRKIDKIYFLPTNEQIW